MSRLLRALADGAALGPRRVAPCERPDLTRHPIGDREAARLQWVNRVVQEHRSVVDFADLLATLADVDAPYEVLCGMERVLRDELRHVALCQRVVDWLGGDDDLEVDRTGFRRPQPLDGDRLELAIVRVLEDVYVAEVASLPIQKIYVDTCTDPAVGAVLAALLADEGLHAVVGAEAVVTLLRCVPRPRRDALAVELTERARAQRALAWEIHRASATGGPGRALGAGLTRAQVDAARARTERHPASRDAPNWWSRSCVDGVGDA